MTDPEHLVKKVIILNDGTFRIDGGMLVYGVPKYYGRKIRAKLKPLYVESGDERILIDTGIGNPPDKIQEIYDVRKDTDLISSLGERDIHPSDVTMVINTHLHFDHAGYNREFDSARFVSQGREIEYALAPDRFQKGGYLKENFESCRFESIEGETEVAPGITVLPTPGHTPGHQSVLIEQKDRTTIYTGDVSPLPVNLEKMLIVGVLHDPVAALQSLNILKDISHGDRQKRFIFSHD